MSTDIKATAKNIWLPVGVVAALLVSTVAVTIYITEGHSTAYAAYDKAEKNEQDIKSINDAWVKEFGQLREDIAVVKTDTTNISKSLDELKKK